MSKEDEIEIDGSIIEVFPAGFFLVQPDAEGPSKNLGSIHAHLAGKLRQNKIRVVLGDRVTLAMSPYDLTKGRIVFRHK